MSVNSLELQGQRQPHMYIQLPKLIAVSPSIIWLLIAIRLRAASSCSCGSCRRRSRIAFSDSACNDSHTTDLAVLKFLCGLTTLTGRSQVTTMALRWCGSR